MDGKYIIFTKLAFPSVRSISNKSVIFMTGTNINHKYFPVTLVAIILEILFMFVLSSELQ